MRALCLGISFLAALVSQAAAQQGFGPVAITNDVYGVPVTIKATAWVNVRSVDDKLMVDARILADLVDVQRQFASVVRALALSAHGCVKGRGDSRNPIVTLESGSLWPRDDQLVMFMRGHIDVWSCAMGPHQAAIRWRRTKVAFIHLKVPTIHTWRNVTKKKDVTQPFHGSVPVYLAEKNNAGPALELAEPGIKLDGQEVVLKNASLQLARANIGQKAYDALQRAIDPANLKQALPAEFQKLNMTVVSARFRGLGGHAIAEVNLAATVSGMSKARLLQRTATNASN